MNAEIIDVYFECDNWYAEHVATFRSDDVYMACLPALEVLAHRLGFDRVTESVREEGGAS